ncbi:DNA resolvase [Burkholderia puraquae]|uniref:DNA resolvase n=1 Tax=Burkholderia puraquae TaxID=1904757 RepID=A0A1X1P5L9_9BURK|nr:recombinase family protein [Burkholderia puraquae]ORT79643.1 DNA resolvase [Burkholderia puraquae]
MNIGYARVSTEEQNLGLQIDALRSAGCHRIFTDRGVSGAEFSRPGLDAVLAQMNVGDTLVVWRLDRLGRSLGKLIELVAILEKHNVHLHSITEAINTNSAGGVLIFHMMGALAQFERSLISERTRAGMNAARTRGSQIGRRRALSQEQRKEAMNMLKCHPITEVARHFGVHPRTVSRIKLEEQ